MPDGDVDVGVAGVPGVPEEAGVTTATEVLDVTGVSGVMGVFGEGGVEAAFVTSDFCVFNIVRHRNRIDNNNTDKLSWLKLMITQILPSLTLLVQLHSVLAPALLLSADLHHRCLRLLDCVYEPSLLANRFPAHHSEF